MNIRLDAGRIRELHWHLAAEWGQGLLALEPIRRCSRSARFWEDILDADGRTVGGARAAGRGVQAASKGGGTESPPDDVRNPVAPSERSKVAGGAGDAGALVEGRLNVHPLVQAGRVGAAAGPSALNQTDDSQEN